MSVVEFIEERIKKWKKLLDLYYDYLYRDAYDLRVDIHRILCELGHSCGEDNFLLSDYYYDPECIKHIIRELETLKKTLEGGECRA